MLSTNERVFFKKIYIVKNHRTRETALYGWLCPKNYVILQINREVSKGTVKRFPDLLSPQEVKKANISRHL